ncbi:MAG: hypothetical protein ACR2ID_10945 [Chthoniobacterales bacterium]
MIKSLALRLLPLLLLAGSSFAADQSDAKAQQLAQDLWKASGGENWAKIVRLQFTFIVEENGKQLASAEHDCDRVAGTDHVKWKGKEATVNVSAPPPQDENGKAAYARWVNDSYWLLAPLKVLDPGVKLTYEGSKEMDGAACETLRMSFAQVGLTPSDQYVLYIDPQTKLLRSWDYIPNSETTMHGTWENYQELAGLKLATAHNFGGKMIRFANVEAK